MPGDNEGRLHMTAAEISAATGGATKPYTRLPVKKISKALLLDAATLTISPNICHDSPTLKLGLLVA